MDDADALRDVFGTGNLWKPSSFSNDAETYESSLFAPLDLDISAIKFDHPYAPKQSLDCELRLPDLETFDFGPLPELETIDKSSLSLETPPLEPEEDVWEVALQLGPAKKDVSFFSWELFEDRDHGEEHTPYITESGPHMFDAALAKDDGNIAPGQVINGNVLLSSLFNLGLGRSSILFSFDPKLRTFVPAIPDGRASGFSLPAAQSLTSQFVHTGNTFLYLRSFVERTFGSASSIPARVALAASVSTVLSAFEDQIGRKAKNIRSLMQLQHVFAKPREILLFVSRIVDAVKPAKSNEQLSSILHHRVLEIEEANEDLRMLSTELMRRVAQPSLDLFAEWIGIGKGQQTLPIAERGSFVVNDQSSESQAPECAYNPEMMPRFISPEDGHTIFDTGNSLCFLKLHHPEHPLACLEKFGVQPPKLEWKYDWQDIETISTKAKQYEEELRSTIGRYTTGVAKEIGPSAASSVNSPLTEDIYGAAENFPKLIENSTKLFDQPPRDMFDSLPDELRLIIDQVLSRTSSDDPNGRSMFSPPVSITSTLSFRPLLTAQAKLVNSTTLRLFFRSHHLRMHLSLQRQYHLLGDGVFSSRLASALFDPERETAERRKGTIRSGVHMGLQVGSRKTWPPASSELRLALMGLLGESYYSSQLYMSTIQDGPFDDKPSRKDQAELPGQLNFAIRTLTEPEMEKVMDPDSLSALDFLRLQYVPPSPLNLVISTASLEKYDTIFKFLLRLLRMNFVVAHLPRAYPDTVSRLFRMEAHHFITALTIYVFQTGIADAWTGFEEHIDNIEIRLAREDVDGQIGTRVTEGLSSLKEQHEKCLDGIMFALLLRRRQKKVLGLVEDIFEAILAFAKVLRGEDGGNSGGGDAEKEDSSVEALYANVKGKIRVFISVCRGLAGKKGYGKGRGSGEENAIERLGVLLEMNGHYAR
ncbi:hypothetical protein P154DRAFT_625856 [Amniculicola lignicola CBS 123094]|uniref:Spindle pole body component n=1 Tax=Amniculicola lignicola CBS 123094 TaxID=1392246 RepID=A0A6A5VVR5_9PLEO|nr:hypothetical protein P154DRAFT_625856 [Amniculicola lignicola CBS 123094]